MEFFVLLVVGSLIAIWIGGISAHELAVQAARTACERYSCQLLDETVVMEKMRPRRAQSGSMRWVRHYGFEFSSVGDERHRGELEVFAGRVHGVTLHLPDHNLHDSGDSGDSGVHPLH